MHPTPLNTAAEFFEAARRHHAAGELGRAEVFYVQAVEHDPHFAAAWFQLGVLAVAVNKLKVAAQMMAKASDCRPREFTYHRARCEIHRRLKELDRAIDHGSQAVALNSEDAESFYNLGLALFDASRFDEAARAYWRAVTIAPDYGLAHNNLGSALEQAGDLDGAYAAYERAADLDAGHCEAQHNLAALENQRGRLSEARKRYHAAIAADPAFVHSHLGLSGLKRYDVQDRHVEMLEGLVSRAPRMAPEAQTKFWFALGKARSDLGQHDASFDAYQRGNALHRQTFAYATEDVRRQIADVIERFDCGPAAPSASACVDATPVFVLGMPRSGSTLIEQILDCHPQISGAGELSEFSDLLTETASLPAGASYVDWFRHAGDDELRGLGERYLERLRDHSRDAVRIVDKMPGNFFYVGLIHKIFPNARVIHSLRNPWDTCVSNFTRLFKSVMPFAYDLTELGQFCRMCDDMMAHWKASLPGRFIHEARYESLVQDLEPQARALIDFCGLPWDDACLAFHKNQRVVKTASHAQVVKPLYRTSVGRWQAFEKHLAPLRRGYEGTPVPAPAG